MVNPADIPLPSLLNPLLGYLKENLPPPVYSLLLNLISHCLAFLSAVLSLLSTLVTRYPSEWDAQTFFPPIIAILTAYLALSSLYRTTSWMFRTSVWFVKWSTILGALIALAGSLFRAGSGDISLAGIASSIVEAVSGMMTDESSRSRRGKGKTGRKGRPKAWESYDKHRDWQYQEQEYQRGRGRGEPTSAEKTVQDFISSIEQSGPWKMAQGFFGSKDEEQNAKTQKRARTRSR